MSRALRLLVWQVHGGWMDAFVRGRHTYLLPVDETGEGGVGGRDWPPSVVEVPEGDLADTPFDAVLLQRLEEFDLVERLTGRKPGVDIPAVFVEHNTPQQDVPRSRHPLADRAPYAHPYGKCSPAARHANRERDLKAQQVNR